MVVTERQLEGVEQTSIQVSALRDGEVGGVEAIVNSD